MSLLSSSAIDRLRQYALLCRMDRPIGTYLLLWPVLWALLIAADGRPDPWILLVFVAGTFLMRSAGCAINDYADRDIDPHIARTANRPLAAGRITPREAVGVFLALALTAFLLVLTLNPQTIALSVVAVALAASYPFMKRVHHLPQAHLGAAFGWAVPMAFAAQSGSVPSVAWLLFLAVLLWAVAYDTMYAMADREEDLKIGVKSSAILFASADRWVIALLQLITLGVLVAVGLLVERGAIYLLGVIAAAGLAIYQQWLIREREPARCLRAFLNNHPFGAVIALALLADYWLPL